MSFRRWFVICLSVMTGVSAMTGTARGSDLLTLGDGLHCHAAVAHEPSPAEKAFLAGNAAQSESLYREDLAKFPHDAALTAGLVRALLRDQKVADAASTVNAELALARTRSAKAEQALQQVNSGTAALRSESERQSNMPPPPMPPPPASQPPQFQ